MVVVVFWSLRITQIMTPALKELARAAERIGGQCRRARVRGRSGVVGKLNRSFNRMSEQLTTLFAALDEDRQQLRAILSGMVEGVVALDADQRILFVNDRAVELLESPIEDAGRRQALGGDAPPACATRFGATSPRSVPNPAARS